MYYKPRLFHFHGKRDGRVYDYTSLLVYYYTTLHLYWRGYRNELCVYSEPQKIVGRGIKGADPNWLRGNKRYNRIPYGRISPYAILTCDLTPRRDTDQSQAWDWLSDPRWGVTGSNIFFCLLRNAWRGSADD